MNSDAGKKRIRKAIVPGSFDPMTVGHLDILRRTAAVFDCVYLALMVNPNKNYLFDAETRLEIARCAAEIFPNVNVVYDEGMLVDLAKKLDCDAIVKGIRNGEDLVYEIKMAEYNRNAENGIETLFLPCTDPKLENVSSTLVRRLLEDGDIKGACALLPSGAIDIIKKRGYK